MTLVCQICHGLGYTTDSGGNKIKCGVSHERADGR